MPLSFRRPGWRSIVFLLAALAALPARAQVGGTPAPPVTFWQFLGIPQGIKKLQGATRNRRGNHPNLEPKPPMRAIADPRNLESPDPSIKKAAEVKAAEDLAKQKIKAVKYLASIGCGCYDIDGGVTAALAASMQDCTEEVRYQTIKAVAEAAENGSCARCGEGCCCNKEILTTLAKIAYERGDDGCYLEPSARVREAAAEALQTCCPNNSPPPLVPAEPPATPDTPETVEPTVPEDRPEGAPLPNPPAAPLPPLPDTSVSLPGRLHSSLHIKPRSEDQFTAPIDARRYTTGVIVHVSPQHRLAHVHFSERDMVPEVGAEIGVFTPQQDGQQLVATLQVVDAYPGSANVTGSAEALANVAIGDPLVLRRIDGSALHADASSATWVSSYGDSTHTARLANRTGAVEPAPKADPTPTSKAVPAPAPKATLAPTPKATLAPTPKTALAPTPKATLAPTPKVRPAGNRPTLTAPAPATPATPSASKAKKPAQASSPAPPRQHNVSTPLKPATARASRVCGYVR